MSVNAGASFTAVTVSGTVVDVDRAPSLTVTVIVAAPDSFAAGVTVTVRLPLLPPNTRLAVGTSAGFDELPETVRVSAAVSKIGRASCRGSVAVSSAGG